MAVHDLGYRGLDGAMTGASHRWIVVANTGIRRAWQSRWLRRMMLFAWLPACWFAFGFFFWEQSLLYPEMAEPVEAFLGGSSNELQAAVRRGIDTNNPAAARHSMWAWLLQSFFRYPQAVVMVIVVGLIAPPLISQDIRSRAFLLYFSRPLTRLDYILGKFVTVWFYLALISTLPALALYLLGILLSPQFSVVISTWDLPFRVLGASAVLAIPTAALALLLSAMTQESRYAGFSWFAIWVLGWVTYGIMTAVEAAKPSRTIDEILSRWSNVSLYHTLGQVQSWVFGFTDFEDVVVPALILVAMTVVCLVLLFRRVAVPLRA